MKRHVGCLILLIAWSLAPLRGLAAAGTYSFQDLGTIGGSTRGIQSQATAIKIVDSQPAVAGGSQIGLNKDSRAFSYSGGVMTNLGTLKSDNTGKSQATAINVVSNKVVVVGWSEMDSTYQHAFAYSEGTMTDLGSLGGTDSMSMATGINESGTVVGWCYTASFAPHAFLKPTGAAMQDLGTLGGSQSMATAINTQGQVVGWAQTETGERHAFLKQPGGPLQDLVTMAGGHSCATAINASGQVVGWVLTSYGFRAFSKDSGGPMQDLGAGNGTQSVANGINAGGQIVGWFATAGGDWRAFVKDPGGSIQDLNGLVPGLPANMTLKSATAITDGGHIVGLTSSDHAFLLTPQ
jgi:probable HAF family extracellular repeat protein